ncbi:MAG TPA: Ig-like domain repeat protein, partial [Iamia sp.]|nr:Ig-like domain repeat protein [Iamia sp.]
MAAVIMPLTLMSAPASAAEPEEFQLDLVAGTLTIRGAETPHVLTDASITGTNTDGALTDVELETPVVTFVRAVPEYNTTATISADFSMIEPGTGSINEQGQMTVQLKVAVDLHITVPILPDPRDCRAAPINLTLTSTSNYNTDTEKVTLAAPNFSVPPVAPTADPFCDGLIAGPVNDALAGSGHAIRMTLDGFLRPPILGEPTATTLAVSPAGSSAFGDDVTLTATVTATPPVPANPAIAGLVSFFDGDTQIGTANVGLDGTASITTADLAAGPAELRAEYSGAPPAWEASVSAVTAHTVTASPLISTTASGEVQPGGPGRDFDVTVTNTGFGAPLEDAHVEVAIIRSPGNGPIRPDGVNPRIVLSRVVGGVPTSIPLTSNLGNPETMSGEVGDVTTWLLDPGESHTEDLRLEIANGVDFGPLSVTFTLVTGDGGDEVTLGSTNGRITIVNAARQPTTISSGDPGFPPFIPEIPPVTPIVRQGNSAELGFLVVNPDPVVEVSPTGSITFAVDGVPVQAQHNDVTKPDANQWIASVPYQARGGKYQIKIPANTPVGTHEVTVRYAGDGLFAPSQAVFPITIETAIGTHYECVGQGFTRGSFPANVVVQANLPTVWAAGQDIDLDRVEVQLNFSRTDVMQQVLNGVDDPDQDDTITRIDLAPNGEVIPSDVERANFTPMQTGDGLGTDSTLDFKGGTGSVSVDHAPGTTVDFTIGTITATFAPGGFLSGIVCTPDPTAYVVGPVTAAGTTLTAEPGVAAALGADVTLTASALPTAP